MACDRLDHARGVGLGQDLVGQPADREDLIGAQRRIGSTAHVIHVDHVEQAAALPVPEALAKSGDTAGKADLVARDPERVQPERLDFDRFADARRDYPVADLGVHPGDLRARLTARQQAVAVKPDPEARTGGVAFENRIDRILQPQPRVVGENRGPLPACFE